MDPININQNKIKNIKRETYVKRKNIFNKSQIIFLEFILFVTFNVLPENSIGCIKLKEIIEHTKNK